MTRWANKRHSASSGGWVCAQFSGAVGSARSETPVIVTYSGRTVAAARDLEVGRSYSQLRRLGCHAGYMIDRHSLADALEFRLALCQRVWRNNFRHSWRAVNFFGDTNLVAIGKVLHPRCDIHRLAKIIEPLVERDRDRGAPMHADLQDEITLRAVPIQLIHGLAHLKRRLDRIGRSRKRRHHGVTDRLGDGTIVPNGGVEKMLEVPLHLNVGVKVADPLVERRRALEIGEYEGNVENRNALRRADHL